MKLYIALLHHPVYNKSGDIITTSITGFDLHDIARSAVTYGVSGYYVVNPISAQRKFAERVIKCWNTGESFDFNPTRAKAFGIMKLTSTLKEVVKDIEEKCNKKPKIIATSAKEEFGIGYGELGNTIKKSDDPYLIIFGTGWGLTKEVIKSADEVLLPIKGGTSYRHLSVRSAVAIILDRLFGEERG